MPSPYDCERISGQTINATSYELSTLYCGCDEKRSSHPDKNSVSHSELSIDCKVDPVRSTHWITIYTEASV